MPSSKRCHYVESGDPPPKRYRKHVETIKFVIHDFKARKKNIARIKFITSPRVEAYGHEWYIRVYPNNYGKFQGNSCYLYIQNHADIIAKQSWRCKGFKSMDLGPTNFRDVLCAGGALERDDSGEGVLEDDSFVMEIDLHVVAKNQRIWYPNELQQQDILVELYQDAYSDTSDVVFSVGGSMYRVHKNILSLRGKKLYEIAKDCDRDVPIPIDSVSGEIFKSVLDFVYTVKAPVIDSEDKATELLVVADRFDCVHLKLYVESVIVHKFLSAENAAELLLLADSHSCALLKEAAMDLFVTDTTTVKKAQAWSQIKESKRLLLELFNIATCSNELEPGLLDVTTLREALEVANLELDGSREVLYDRLKAHLTTITT